MTGTVNAAFTASVFDGLGEAVLVTDDQLKVIAWNSAMERHTGLARSQVMDRPAPALLTLLGEQSEARLATWRTDSNEVGGLVVSIQPAAFRRREDRFLRAVEAIGHSLASSSEVTGVLDTVAATAMEVMAADSALVVGWDGEGSVFDVVSVVGRLSKSYAPGGRIPMARGPLGRATIEGRTIVTQDILNDPDVVLSAERAERVAREGFRAVVASPVVAKGVVHGALAAYYWSARSFTDDEIAALQLLGQHAALAIDHARSHSEATRRAARLRGLADVEELVSGSLDLDEVLRRITQATARLVSAPAVQMWTADHEARVLRRRAATVESEDIRRAMLDVLPFGEGVSGRAAELKTPIWVPDLRSDPAAPTVLKWAIDLGLARMLALPILAGDDLLGMLTIFGRRDWVWSDEERALVTSIAARAAAALQNARAYALAVQNAERLRALVAVGQSITASLDVPDVMGRITAAAAGMRPGAIAAMHKVDADAAVFRLVATGGPDPAGMPEEMPIGRGLPGLVTEQRGPVLVERPAEHPASAVPDWWRAHPGATYYGLPIVAGDAFVGVLTYIAPDGRPGVEEQEALRLLAAYAGIAIRNASLYQTERSQAERIRALATVNRRISSALDLDELLASIAQSAVRLIGVRYVSFWVADEGRRTLTLGASSSADVTEAFSERRLTYDEGAVGWVARHHVPLVIDDVFVDGRVAGRGWWERWGLRSVLCVPVMSSEGLLAVLALSHSTPIRFAPDVRDLMELFVAQAAIAIQNARLYRDAERRRDVAEGLARLGRELTATLDVDRLGALACRGVLSLLRAGEAAVYLHEHEDGGERRIGAQPEEAQILEDEVGASVAGLASREQTIVVVRDVRDEAGLRLGPAARARLEAHRQRVVIGVPLVTPERVIGALVVAAPAAGEFTSEESQTLQTAADRVALAIDNARLYAETERERREAAALAGAARRLALHLDFDELATELVTTLLELFQAHGSAFYRLRDDGMLEAIVFAGAMSAHMQRSYLMPPNAGLVGRTVSERAPAWSRDLLVDPRVYLPGDVRTTIERSGNRGVLAVPLMAKNAVVGSLLISFAAPRDFSRREIALLQAFADTAALALENARLYASVRDNLVRLRDTQAQLVQAAKMSALGQLVSGVAHELNNPLSVIIGYGQLLLAREVPAPLRRPVELMVAQGDRMAKIVKNLLLFARQRSPERAAVDVNDVIEQTLTLRQHQLQLSGIRVERELDRDLPKVAGDAQQLQQVVLNLVLNAEQAILEGGRGSRIVLRTRPGPDGRTVRAQVIDDGPGIPAGTLPRVFEPFFTTKEVGTGTGLGLSVSYGIVEEHHGQLSVESVPGSTTFTMELPVGTPESSPPPLPAVLAPERMDGRVALVVEDEPDVQDMVVALLREAGWSVEVASGGRAALEQLRRRGYDLVISDMRMPEGSGEELYRGAVALDPDLGRRFLFLSGDTANHDVWRFLNDVDVPAIEKPFPPAQFLETVRRIASPLTTSP